MAEIDLLYENHSPYLKEPLHAFIEDSKQSNLRCCGYNEPTNFRRIDSAGKRSSLIKRIESAQKAYIF